jgi:hypothetical protein
VFFRLVEYIRDSQLSIFENIGLAGHKRTSLFAGTVGDEVKKKFFWFVTCYTDEGVSVGWKKCNKTLFFGCNKLERLPQSSLILDGKVVTHPSGNSLEI